MPTFDFKQLDVFSRVALKGNPLAVVFGADSLTDQQMADFANWTNLSETTFLLTPRDPKADYRVRIFTTLKELPFAGHPTLGSCHAWLQAGGIPKGEEIIQECEIGLVRIRRQGDELAFIAPPLLRSGPVEASLIERVRLALMLSDRDQVLELQPDYSQLLGLAVGVIAPCDPARDDVDAQFEVRAFIAGDGAQEDPATGSLNAGVAQWLLAEGLAPERYVVSQGTAIGRAGRIRVERQGDEIWVGGAVAVCIEGRLQL